MTLQYPLHAILTTHNLTTLTHTQLEDVCTGDSTIFTTHNLTILTPHDLTILTHTQLEVSFAKEPYKRDFMLQKRPVIVLILLTVATPYAQLATHITHYTQYSLHTVLTSHNTHYTQLDSTHYTQYSLHTI